MTFFLFFLLSGPIPAQVRPAGAAVRDLQYIVIVSRHGVRSPTWTLERLNQYSAQPWPAWDAPPGELTSHGRVLVKQLGAYWRLLLAHEGLIASEGCSDANRVHVRADLDQRTLETGKAFAEGFLPGCAPPVRSAVPAANDHLFDPLTIPIGKPDRSLALASVMGRVGGHVEDLPHVYRPAFQELERILLGGGKAPRSLFDDPMSIVEGKGDNLVDVTGALRTASTLTENLLLEYANGFADRDLGWGHLNAANLLEVMVLHTAYADLARRTPYLARAGGSNLLAHVVASIAQAVVGTPVAGAIGPPATRVLFLSGHDTNLSNLSGMLGLDWLLPGYQPGDTPPSGALVFELRRRGQEAPRVRTYFIAQSLDQMHRATPLTLDAPPLRAPVFVPGCSSAAEGYDCRWTAFRHAAEAAIDRSFVQP